MFRMRMIVVVALISCLLLVTSGISWADNTRKIVGKDRVHVVRTGENLYSIALDYGLAIEHLAFANQLNPNSINVAVGTELVIPTRRVLPANPPENGLVVNIPERGVFLFRNGSFVKFYPVAIGQPGRFATPLGNYSISSMAKDPVWLPPEWAGQGEEPVPAGPSNPLGDRWIGITAPGIGLHSTTSPMSIGQAVSHGCMRMYPNSVHELFERVDVGWPVRIEYETAKVGYDTRTKTYGLVTFPDVYGCANPFKSASQALLDCGFGVDEGDLQASVFKDGVVIDLTTAATSIVVNVLVNDEPCEWPCDAVLCDGVVMAPAKVASKLNLGVTWDGERQVVRVSRGDLIMVFPLKEDYDMSQETVEEGKRCELGGLARMNGSTAMIPMRPLLNGFKVPNTWDDASKTLRVYSLK